MTGCQRSGTTALTELIQSSDRVRSIDCFDDSELEGALILSGRKRVDYQGRWCFQTTFVNFSIEEYLAHRGSYKLIFVVRNPFS